MKLRKLVVARRLIALTAAVTLGCGCWSPLYAKKDPGHGPGPGRSSRTVIDTKVPPAIIVPGHKGQPVPVPTIHPPMPVPTFKHRPPGPVPTVQHRPPGPPVVGHHPPPAVRPRKPYYREHDWVRRYDPWPPRHYGRFYPTLPPNVFSFYIGGAAFFYYSGIYYRHSHNGYVVVEAPIGARVHVLPDSCSYFSYRGDRCYACNDVFYRQAGSEYVVIERPLRWDDVVQAGDYVRITTDTLNVRSGPGTGYYVIAQVSRGDVVQVGGMEDGWFYIEFDDGSYGWVMQSYTVPYEIR